MSEQGGEWIEFTDGSQAFLTDDNLITDAYDANGEPDPDLQAYADAINDAADDWEPDEALERELAQAAIEDRIAELEQLAAEPVVVAAAEPIDTIDPERVVEDWHADQADIEGAFDRKLTNRERRELGTHAANHGFTNLIDAAADLAERGRPVIVDLDDENVSEHERDHRRQAHMIERLQDIEGSSGDAVTGRREPTRHEVNLDNDRERHDWLVDQLTDGVDTSEVATYDSTTFREDS